MPFRGGNSPKGKELPILWDGDLAGEEGQPAALAHLGCGDALGPRSLLVIADATAGDEQCHLPVGALAGRVGVACFLDFLVGCVAGNRGDGKRGEREERNEGDFHYGYWFAPRTGRVNRAEMPEWNPARCAEGM